MLRRHGTPNGVRVVALLAATCVMTAALILFLIATTTTTTTVAAAVTVVDANSDAGTTNHIVSDDIPHPDPNDEDHEGMIYVGRLCPNTKRRLLANESYSIKYIFGSSFEYTPNNNDNNDNNNNNNNDGNAAKDGSSDKKLKSFGHVETHPLDGGVVPQQLVTVAPFYMDAKPVSNAEFANFIARTAYITEAQRFGWSYVLDSMIQHMSSDHKQSFHFEGTDYRNMSFESDPMAKYWVAFQFVDWKEPYGQRTKYKPDHPVVHVSHRDAAKYCQWRNNARLPGEREYEAAARYIPLQANEEHSQDEQGNVVIKVVPLTDEEIENYIPPRSIYQWGNDSDWTIAQQYSNLCTSLN